MVLAEFWTDVELENPWPCNKNNLKVYFKKQTKKFEKRTSKWGVTLMF
jgi:hypothetical protein